MAEETPPTVEDVLKEFSKPRLPSNEERVEKSRIWQIDHALRELAGNKKIRKILEKRRSERRGDELALARDEEGRLLLTMLSNGGLRGYHPTSTGGERDVSISYYELVSVGRPIKGEKKSFKLEKSVIGAHRDYIEGGKAFVCVQTRYGKEGDFLVDRLEKDSFGGLNNLTAEGIQKTAAVELREMLPK